MYTMLSEYSTSPTYTLIPMPVNTFLSSLPCPLKGFIVLLLLILKINSGLVVHLILGDYKMPMYCQNMLRKRREKKNYR